MIGANPMPTLVLLLDLPDRSLNLRVYDKLHVIGMKALEILLVFGMRSLSPRQCALGRAYLCTLKMTRRKMQCFAFRTEPNIMRFEPCHLDKTQGQNVPSTPVVTHAHIYTHIHFHPFGIRAEQGNARHTRVQ